ncbi:hypothetical protein [Martelella alba]|uniref:hypothetical protein n=1 Tax=Martelella alba TaxID=2590451 RepID=UPI0018AD3FD1|nr:hypothetical protein [Martelella alba]
MVASRGFALTIASDAHTTAHRRYASALQLIGQHNDVWSTLSIPGNHIVLKTTEQILSDWRH